MDTQVELQQNLNKNNSIITELKKFFDKRIDHEIIESVAYETNYNIDQATNCLLDMLKPIPIPETNYLSDEACSVAQIPKPSLSESPTDTILVDLSVDEDTPRKSPFEKHYDQLINSIQRGIKILVILRGVPGSGKSYLAQEIVHKSYGDSQFNNFIFCADDYFVRNGRYLYNPQMISEAHKWNQDRARASIKDGVSPVVIDNTNTQAWELKPYLAWAVEEGYDIEILEPNTPWAFNERELFRRNVHAIPKTKIRDMLDRYEKGLTVENLCLRFGFSYKSKLPPQLRNFPPIKKIITDQEKKQTIEDLFGMFNASGTQPLEPKKYIEKKHDLTDWNVTSDDLKSWDLVLRPEYQIKKGPNNLTLKTNTPKEASTLTTYSDFTSPKGELKPEYRILKGPNGLHLRTNTPTASTKEASTLTTYSDLTSPKGEKIIKPNGDFHNIKSFPLIYPREGYMDISTITDEALPNEEEVFFLFELFHNIPEDYVRDIYEKCQKNLEWATEILLSDKKEFIPNYHQEVIVHDESLDKEELPIKKFIEEVPKQTITQEQKDEIKQAIESSITINKEHYSQHLLKLKKLVLTDEPKPNSQELNVKPSTSRIDFHTEAGTVIAVDSDSEFDSSDGSEDSDGQETMELYIGNEMVQQMQKSFVDFHLDFPQGFQPVIEIHKSLARQIYALYLESVFKQMDAQNLVLQEMLKEDEEFAKKLQQEEYFVDVPEEIPDLKKIMSEQWEQSRRQKNMDEWKNLTPDDIAYKMKKQKLICLFPDVEEDTLILILSAYNNNYQDTVDAVIASGVKMVDKFSRGQEEPISEMVLNDMKEDHLSAVEDEEDNLIDKSPSALRNEASQHQQKREELITKAQNYYRNKMYGVALFYSELASKQTHLCEKYNELAAEETLRVNFNRLQNFDTLDLHHLRVKEALNALDIFLDRNIMLLKSGKQKKHNYLMIITGRGKNSPGNVPKIKPAVKQRLKARGIKVDHVNPGLLRVKILKSSLMTDQCA